MKLPFKLGYFWEFKDLCDGRSLAKDKRRLKRATARWRRRIRDGHAVRLGLEDYHQWASSWLAGECDCLWGSCWE